MSVAFRVLLSLAVATALVVLLLEWTGTSAGEVYDTLRAIDPAVYLAALGVQALIYPARALRFAALMPAAHRPSLGRLLPVTAAHILAANVLPAKVGEATLVLSPQALRPSGRHCHCTRRSGHESWPAAGPPRQRWPCEHAAQMAQCRLRVAVWGWEFQRDVKTGGIGIR